MEWISWRKGNNSHWSHIHSLISTKSHITSLWFISKWFWTRRGNYTEEPPLIHLNLFFPLLWGHLCKMCVWLCKLFTTNFIDPHVLLDKMQTPWDGKYFIPKNFLLSHLDVLLWSLRVACSSLNAPAFSVPLAFIYAAPSILFNLPLLLSHLVFPNHFSNTFPIGSLLRHPL